MPQPTYADARNIAKHINAFIPKASPIPKLVSTAATSTIDTKGFILKNGQGGLISFIHELTAIHFSDGAQSHFTINGDWILVLMHFYLGRVTENSMLSIIKTAFTAKSWDKVKDAVKNTVYQETPRKQGIPEIGNIHFYLGEKPQQVVQGYTKAAKAAAKEANEKVELSWKSAENLKVPRLPASPAVSPKPVAELSKLTFAGAHNSLNHWLAVIPQIGPQIIAKDKAFLNTLTSQKLGALDHYFLDIDDLDAWKRLDALGQMVIAASTLVPGAHVISEHVLARKLTTVMDKHKQTAAGM